jgi:hypothetical protein
MKLRFYRRWFDDTIKDITLECAMSFEPTDEAWEKKWQEKWGKVEPDSSLTSAMAKGNSLMRPYSTYLASSLVSDFPSHYPDWTDTVLQDIEKLERGDVEAAEWEGDGFWHHISRTTVAFEHAIFGECPEWPIWWCTLAQYKAALQGWRKFIDMPKSIDSELIVELPDDTLRESGAYTVLCS